MTDLRATYRLQFREGMDFRRAEALVPYWRDLGISHLYASPIFEAVPGSTHGYDVVDHGRADPAVGGDVGLRSLADTLHGNGLGLILDIVPNHMAASPYNPWWLDVLRHGRESRFAGHFDIDWTAPRLVLPVLGRPYGKALADGELTFGCDWQGLSLRYFEHAFPLDPATWSILFSGVGDRFSGFPATAGADFAAWSGDPANAGALANHLAGLSRDSARVHLVHEAQPWRLAHWRRARDQLGYRRFFEIADLVGVRVEDPAVFDDVHRHLFDLVDTGIVDGVRVDHIDGLADPDGYLVRLRQGLPRPVPVWVEKILARGESMPESWSIAGTTGYETGDLIGAVLTDAAAARQLDRAYASVTGSAHHYPAMLDAAKREILNRNLASELDFLTRRTAGIAAESLSDRDWGTDSLRRGLSALLRALPVYRTYLTDAAPGPHDRRILDAATAEAAQDPDLDDPAVVPAVVRLLVEARGELGRTLRARFQQTSGALMAKAVEDTLFYRFNRLISANEVGGEPCEPGLPPAAFHEAVVERARSQPDGLNATATHDTKRGEDARMRIAAIGELPQAWTDAVGRFEIILGDRTIDAETRWLFYQALLGAWTAPAGGDGDLPNRIAAYLVKAAREAKRTTSWVRTDSGYEDRLTGFAGRTMANPAFVEAFATAAAPFIEIGERKSLAQLALKLTLPGIPDIYQGTETADLSFVDPDNRRPVDFEARVRSTSDWPDDGSFDERKSALMRFCLDLRRRYPAVFAGGYRPIATATGPRLLAFARESEAHMLLVIADTAGTGRVEPAPPGDLFPRNPPLARFPDPITGQDPSVEAARSLSATGVAVLLYGSG